MGAYITVKTNKRCPACNAKIDEWQSKYVIDKLGYFLARAQTVKLKDIKEGEMYTSCDERLGGCGAWTTCWIKNGKVVKVDHEPPYSKKE